MINKIHNMDCCKGMKKLDDAVVDLVVTSPPYDNLRDYNGFAFDINEISKELYRVLKPGGVVVWIVGDATLKGSETGTSFRQALTFMDNGFNLHDTMIYKKNTSSFPAKRNGKRYTQIFEYMFIFSKGAPKTVNLICDKPNKWAGHTNWGKNTQRDKNGELKQTTNIKEVPEFSPRNNIWEYVVGGGFATSDKIAHEHPAIFPEKLAEDHIITWSNENDVVMDIFIGSGTTAKMAYLNNRNYIGFDISEEYVNLSKRRLEQVKDN